MAATINNDTLSAAGFDREIENLGQRRAGLVSQSEQMSQERQNQFGHMERLTQEKIAATEPVRSALEAKAKAVPSLKVEGQETTPDYVRPTMDPKDVQQSFGMLMAASLLTGLASRAPFHGAMNAFSAGLNGFMNQDAALVKQSLAEFDRNVQSIKARNDSKREEVDRAFKDYANDLQGLKTQLELISTKYDDPMALATARTRSVGEAQKVIEQNIRSVDSTVERLLRDKANQEATLARMEEARARRAEAAGRQEEAMGIRQAMLDLARQREERLQADSDARGEGRRFKDVNTLRTQYLKQSDPLRTDLQKIERILFMVNKGGFSDLQLRQAITDYQKGSRGTNYMIKSMENFGTLDERIAGTFNRFFEGEYTPEQSGQIVDLFKNLRDKVILPGLETKKQEYRFLAERNRLPADEVVVEPGAFPAVPGAPAPAPAAAPGSMDGVPTPTIKITPRK